MKKSNILVDLDRLKYLYCGLGQVAYNFGKELGKLDDPLLHFTFLVPRQFKGHFGNLVDYEITSFKRRYLPFLCKKYDLWHAIHQDSAFLPSNNHTPYLLTIHDLNFLQEKIASKAKKRLTRLQKKVNRACKILTISKFTKSVIRQNLNLDNKRVEVIYNGVATKTTDSDVKPDFVPEGKFLFTISVVKPKKNMKVLVGFIKELKDYNLIIAGDKSDNYAKEIEESVMANNLGKRIILCGKVSDHEKSWLYKNCEAFLFPSLYEGFGLPVIEAMSFGKPVFCSAFSSLPEIGSHHAYYWDSFDSQNMIRLFNEKMAEFSSDPKKPSKIKQYANQFSWKKNADEYIKIYKQILNLRL